MRAKNSRPPSPKESLLRDNPYAAAKGIIDSADIREDGVPFGLMESLCHILQSGDPNIALATLVAELGDALISRAMRERETYLTDKEVAARYSLSKQTIWRWTAERPSFPKPIKFENGTTRWAMSQLIEYEALTKGAQE